MTLTATDIRLGRRLGAGGEAEVFEVASRPGTAFKRYLRPSAERVTKLRLMIDHPPSEAGRHGGHLSMAWPEAIMNDAGGRVTGFTMPAVDLASSVPVFQVYNPQSRRAVAPAFTWRYLLRTARNLAAIVDALHRAGYVIGDVNESNFLVTRTALVVLVDCDSLQVTDPRDGSVYPCPVAKPEFTAPEFQSGAPSDRDRTFESDDFSLAVLIHLLLMEGVHPFSGIWRGRGDPPDLGARIASRSPAGRPFSRIDPPPAALSRRVLPGDVGGLMGRALGPGLRRPRSRPSAREWVEALDRAEAELRSCDRSPFHVFAPGARRCPWCTRIDLGLPDPFPGPSGHSALARRPPPWWRAWRRAAAAHVRRAPLLARTFAGHLRSVLGGMGTSLRSVLGGIGGRGARQTRREPLGRVVRVPLVAMAGAIASLVPALGLAAVVALAAVPRSRRAASRWVFVAIGAVAAVVAATWGLGAGSFASHLLRPLGLGRALVTALVVAASISTIGKRSPSRTPRPRLASMASASYLVWVIAAVAVIVAFASPAHWWPLPVH